MGKLSVAVLGTPEVRHNDHILRFSVARALALLLYMVVQGGLHPIKELIELFWPGLDWETGRDRIQNALHFLSQELQEGVSSPDTPHIISTHDACGCNFSSGILLDLACMQRALDVLCASSPGTNVQYEGAEPLSEEILQEAIARYRGTFLEGFYLDHAPRFVEWVALQRETWHNAIGVIFDRLSQMQEASGQPERAIETAKRWIERDPLNEVAYQRLMQLYFGRGDSQAALLTYRQCRVILAEQLNARLAQETAYLAEQVSAQGHPHSVTTNSWRTGRMTTARPLLAAVFHEGPFVGRATKMNRLVEVYKHIQIGQAGIVTVKGEAGIGKTRLVSEFLEHAAAQGADVLVGRAFETGGHSPYLPLIEMLELRSRQREADKANDTLNNTLSHMLTEMHNYTLLQSYEKTAHKRLLEAFTLLGQALAKQGPVVLFVDDIQWADAASLDMLRYACRRWTESGTPLLVILTVRTESLATIPTFAAWLAPLERELYASSFILNAFTQEETLQFVQAIAVKEEDSPETRLESFGRWLYSETYGQPFYMAEALKALSEQNLLTLQRRADGTWALDFTLATNEKLQRALPPDMRAVVSTRIKQATPAASALLAAAAVLGRSFTFERVCRVADETEGYAALDEVLKRHFCHALADSFVFTHDKIREAVYTEIPLAERRSLHGRALEVLRSEGVPAGLLVYHALEGGIYEQAFHLYITAGDEALRLFALRDAIVYYESARQLLMGKQPAALSDVVLSAIEHLSIQLGRVYELANEREHAIAIYQAMLARRGANATTTKCIALNQLALVTQYESSDEDAALLEQGPPQDERDDRSETNIEVTWQLAQLCVQRFDRVRALQQSDRAWQLAREQGMPELVARALFTSASAKMLANEWREAERRAEEARLLYERQQDRPMEAFCLLQVAQAKMNAGYPRDSIIASRAAYRVFTDARQDWGRIYAAHHLVAGLLDVGAYGEALTLAQEVLALARFHNTGTLLYLGLTASGRVQRALMDASAAYGLHREAMSVFGLDIPPFLEGVLAAELCADCAIAGEWPEARSYAVQALTERSDTTFLYAGLTRWHETEMLVRTGYSERVVADVEQFGRILENSRRYHIAYRRAQAVLSHWREEFELAHHHLREAALLAEEIGLPGEQWLIEVARGDIYRTQGNRAEAQSAFARAEEIARPLANQIEDQQVRTKFLAQVQRLVSHIG